MCLVQCAIREGDEHEAPGVNLCFYAAGEGDLQMANQRVPEEHAGNELEHRQDQGWREHVSAEGERENEEDISDLTGMKEYAAGKH